GVCAAEAENVLIGIACYNGKVRPFPDSFYQFRHLRVEVLGVVNKEEADSLLFCGQNIWMCG
ncbi:hypothetical protein M1L21_45185, partial [Streptomyces sp. AS02]